ncbi:MAG: pyrroline-5-carboxylate reductase [Pseudomonadota bacterium]
MAMTRDLAVIGAGKLGGILLKSLVEQGVVAPERAVATVHRSSSVIRVQDMVDVEVLRENRDAVAGARMVLLAVKPQALLAVIDEIAPVLTADQLLLSIVASVSTQEIEARLERPTPVIRAMPNTPALVGAGMTVLSPGAHADERHLADAKQLFSAIGRTRVLEEKHMDTVTALSASGAAFLYVVLESLAEGGVKLGLPREVATELAAQTALGSARMVLETGDHPAVLKDAVTTPAGCTIDGLLALEAGGVRVTLIQAVVEAARRAGELA